MDHKDLDAWKQAIQLVEDIYQLIRQYPKEETYGLISQIRRAAISIPSNLAEGAGRKSTREFLNFISIALGSLAELETQLIIAARLGYPEREGVMERLTRVRTLVLGLRNHLLTKVNSP